MNLESFCCFYLFTYLFVYLFRDNTLLCSLKLLENCPFVKASQMLELWMCKPQAQQMNQTRNFYFNFHICKFNNLQECEDIFLKLWLL